MTEFEMLFLATVSSGCAKKHTAAGTYVNGEFRVAVNRCEFQGDVCPRLNLPSGQGYELCQAKHAEANLAAEIKTEGGRSDGVAWIVGHYWACEPCAAALKGIGASELRIKEHKEERHGNSIGNTQE